MFPAARGAAEDRVSLCSHGSRYRKQRQPRPAPLAGAPARLGPSPREAPLHGKHPTWAFSQPARVTPKHRFQARRGQPGPQAGCFPRRAPGRPPAAPGRPPHRPPSLSRVVPPGTPRSPSRAGAPGCTQRPPPAGASPAASGPGPRPRRPLRGGGRSRWPARGAPAHSAAPGAASPLPERPDRAPLRPRRVSAPLPPSSPCEGRRGSVFLPSAALRAAGEPERRRFAQAFAAGSPVLARPREAGPSPSPSAPLPPPYKPAAAVGPRAPPPPPGPVSAQPDAAASR